MTIPERDPPEPPEVDPKAAESGGERTKGDAPDPQAKDDGQGADSPIRSGTRADD